MDFLHRYIIFSKLEERDCDIKQLDVMKKLQSVFPRTLNDEHVDKTIESCLVSIRLAETEQAVNRRN